MFVLRASPVTNKIRRQRQIFLHEFIFLSVNRSKAPVVNSFLSFDDIGELILGSSSLGMLVGQQNASSSKLEKTIRKKY